MVSCSSPEKEVYEQQAREGEIVEKRTQEIFIETKKEIPDISDQKEAEKVLGWYDENGNKYYVTPISDEELWIMFPDIFSEGK